MIQNNQRLIIIAVLFVLFSTTVVIATTLSSVNYGVTNIYNQSTWRGNLTFNFTTNGPAMNVTFYFVTASGGASGKIPINITVLNDTPSDTFWNVTVDSGAGTSGGTMIGTWVTTSGTFNVTVTIQNFSYPGIATEPAPELNRTLVGMVQGGGFSYYNTPPKIPQTNFTINRSNTNNQNFTGGELYFNATAADSTTSQDSCVGVVGLRFNIALNGVTTSNVYGISNQSLASCGDPSVAPIRKSFSYWNTTATITGNADGLYTVTVYANDSIYCAGYAPSGGAPSQSYCGPNINLTTNLNFALDTTAPNVTGFVMNFTNASNLSLSSVGKIEFNVTANDSTTSVQSVKIGYHNGNGTELNLSANRNSTRWSVELPVSTITDGVYTIQYYVNDSVNNFNQSRNNSNGPLTFTLDRIGPMISSFWMNTSNATNFSSSMFSSLIFNATVNDTTSTVTNVLFGFYNGNSTGVNITATKGVAGVWSATVNNQLNDGVYTVLLAANDTVSNLNTSIANLTFTLDRIAPNVTGLFYSISSERLHSKNQPIN